MANVASVAGGAAGTAIGGPAGAAIGAEVGSIFGSVFHSSAAGPNADAAKAVFPLAQGGNLTAVALIITRTGIQTLTSQKPWVDALNQLQQSQPNFITQANARFPGNNWQRFGAIRPEDCVAAVSGANAVYATEPATGPAGAKVGGSGILADITGGGSSLSGTTVLVVLIVTVLAFSFFKRG